MVEKVQDLKKLTVEARHTYQQFVVMHGCSNPAASCIQNRGDYAQLRDSDGLQGRVLCSALDVLDLRTGRTVSLLKNDRLEPYSDIVDIYSLPDSPANSFLVHFFRPHPDVNLTMVPLLMSYPYMRFEYLQIDVISPLETPL